MSDKMTQKSINVWSSLVERMEALIEPMRADARSFGNETSLAAVMRAALHEGVRVLEERYGLTPGPQGEGPETRPDAGEERP